ncbi:uncharacterized protein CCOS01_06048 [Colletotrichum costaricense]|uniref:Uncharacterized protein n=1 Tax=Colletotrichum costaricense TaxID=1209916 RepID=A0AAI9Z1L0_9PEZI|nr:uncharacterized protein CCOS01_06048 [Colletotrichum costaricense]KAK1530945.1 hypothetical protein CCOS01_06048 [Colletotrichum costaricense]
MLLAGTVVTLPSNNPNHSLAHKKLHVTHHLDGGQAKKEKPSPKILYPSISLSRAISQSLTCSPPCRTCAPAPGSDLPNYLPYLPQIASDPSFLLARLALYMIP